MGAACTLFEHLPASPAGEFTSTGHFLPPYVVELLPYLVFFTDRGVSGPINDK
jgi:hypothetical protein